ncbi:MAG TPA: dihydrofolate reductase family protein [Hydrogenophaga sp.]|uniref:dihydrofolate reductase family protein n=1 Tax=Hydrogenophaga sp. TaxID=1904254 RepID=UPI002B8A4C00|nr:dihydrofolate reductase family protein [Hydrogenophaga sp.]HSX92475.1 dihydrofolate reductase family protein [Hydrogenophaga sp.]
MKTQYYTACSLDGFIADDHHSLDWLFQLGNDADADIETFMAGVGALAMGSSTYEWMLRHHVKPGQPDGQPWPYALPCWVFSSREQAALPGADIHFVRGDVRPVHAEMVAAAKGRNLWVMGGGELVGQFHDHGLLDELIVTIGSVTLGSGAPLLPRRIVSPPLRLLDAKAFGTGFAQLRYEVVRA